jgi:hypothetical protein
MDKAEEYNPQFYPTRKVGGFPPTFFRQLFYNQK